MALPISRSAFDRLGKRLGSGTPISQEDREILVAALDAYDVALGGVEEMLAALGYAPVTRLKTTATLVEKLCREKGMGLKGVQDIAGARIVVTGGRAAQDEVVERICGAALDAGLKANVKDRRIDPSCGYRAVHVIMIWDGLPVEVQIRTDIQNDWAQIFESLGDEWGRAIRYGGEPDEPDVPAFANESRTRREVLEDLQGLSELIDRVEALQVSLNSAELRGIVLGKVMERVVDRPDFPEGAADSPEVREIAEVTLNEHLDELKLELRSVEENMRGKLRQLAESVNATESDE